MKYQNDISEQSDRCYNQRLPTTTTCHGHVYNTLTCRLFRSIGVLAYVMLTGISPFLGEDKQETFLNISQLNVSYTEEELQHLDQAAVSFIQTLLCKQPQSVHVLLLSQTHFLHV